ncbi:RNA polymerase sigma-70 factor [Chitinophaga sp.]|uniref:RNA polymerase sigma factor n=1 Tax=Chitinophaga sp. TaxID=1869181 RepID=UPI0031DC0FA9
MSTGEVHTDKELFHLIAEGNEAAFSRLFHRYFNTLYAAMLRYTKVPDDAEDIVQSVFVKLWEKRSMMPAIEKPLGWMFMAARNEFLDRFRKRSAEAGYQQYLKDIFDEERNTPEHLLLLRQKEELWKKAMMRLSPQQRESFLLNREAGLTYDEIALKMGIARTTVKEHISRALRSIRSYLAEHADVMFLLAGTLFRCLAPC